MNASALISNLTQALKDEIAAGGPDRKLWIRNRRLIGNYEGGFLYEFDASTDLGGLPDGTYAAVILNDDPSDQRWTSGPIISSEGSRFCIELKEKVEDRGFPLEADRRYSFKELIERFNSRPLNDSTLVLQLLGLVEEKPLPLGFTQSRGAFPCPPSLGVDVQEALQHVLQRDFSFVSTPPGTDHPALAAACAVILHQQWESILLVASRTETIDAITLALVEMTIKSPAVKAGDVIRLGTPIVRDVRERQLLSPSTVIREKYPGLYQQLAEQRARYDELLAMACAHYGSSRRGHLKEAKTVKERVSATEWEIARLVSEAITSAKVVVANLITAQSESGIYSREFDTVIINEAHLALVPEIAHLAMLATRRVIVLGDLYYPLPLIRAKSEAASRWLKQDIFTASGLRTTTGNWQSDPRLIALTVQRRMHPVVGGMVNAIVYGGKLSSNVAVVSSSAKAVALAPNPGAAVVFCDISGCRPTAARERDGYSRYSLTSGLLSVGLAKALVSSGAEKVAIFSPYGKQVGLERALIGDQGISDRVLVSTMHRIPAGAWDAAIVDLVDSPPFSEPGKPIGGSFASDSLRLLHTAVAGAKGKLIWIGDPHFLMQTSAPDSVLRAFLNQMHQMRVPWTAFPFSLLQTQPAADAGVSFFLHGPEMWDQIFADLATAEHRIIWNWPSVNVNEVLTGELLSKSLATRAAVFIAGPLAPENRALLESRQIRIVDAAADDWLLVIDEETTWYLGWTEGDLCIRPSVRVKGRKASLQIAELCGLKDLIPPRAKGIWDAPGPKPGCR